LLVRHRDSFLHQDGRKKVELPRPVATVAGADAGPLAVAVLENLEREKPRPGPRAIFATLLMNP
jgi:hypothetical protein